MVGQIDGTMDGQMDRSGAKVCRSSPHALFFSSFCRSLFLHQEHAPHARHVHEHIYRHLILTVSFSPEVSTAFIYTGPKLSLFS